MALFDIIMLSLIQGITEFLPISSSGHLALWPLLTGRADQGVTMDVAVHIGTLVAVCLYFRADIGRLLTGLRDLFRGQTGTADARLLLLIALATVPAVLFGLILKLAGVMAVLRTVEVIGWATLIGGILLWIADRYGRESRTAESWGPRDAMLMGLAQAVALIPGTSRSGITMTMGRALGLNRVDAARYSMLMAVPIILAAGGGETLGLIAGGDLQLGSELLLGAALSCLSALAALWAMFRMFQGDWTMTPFVIYRLILGVALLAIAYG
ncbi:MAG: undecaprenyl-diphosphate phosphatase [Pseudomonadota bacterium]